MKKYITKLKTKIYDKLWYYPQTLSSRSFRKKKLRDLKIVSQQVGQLTKAQIREVNKFWAPFRKLNNYDGIRFYSGITGKFSPCYLPDDIYYSDIDRYFNEWRRADGIDNKCYYDKILLLPTNSKNKLNNLSLCRSICYCINGYWQKKMIIRLLTWMRRLN